LIICLGLGLSGGLSGCKVITPTPPPFNPPEAGFSGEEMQHAYPGPSVGDSQVSAKGLEGSNSGEALASLTSAASPIAHSAVSAAAGVDSSVAGLPYYQIQSGSPAYLENFARSEACGWMGVAGQVFDISGNPIPSMVVTAGGTLNGRSISNQGTTGNSPAYGPGGYEIDLGAAAENSTQTVWIQLANAAGQVLTPPYYIDTIADCQKNLILVNFQQVPSHRIIFPLISR